MRIRLRLWRFRLGRWLLHPYLQARFDRADALMAEPSVDSGYRMGVWSSLRDILDLRHADSRDKVPAASEYACLSCGCITGQGEDGRSCVRCGDQMDPVEGA